MFLEEAMLEIEVEVVMGAEPENGPRGHLLRPNYVNNHFCIK